MKRWIKNFENVFVSVTFAEMGEHHTSMEILDIQSKNFPALREDEGVYVIFADAV